MKGELVRAWTGDGLQLQGLLCSPEGDKGSKAILHIHGSASNFYRNYFVEYAADEFVSRGYAFLTGNTRGHDIVNRLYRREASGPEGLRAQRGDSTSRSYIIGGAREIFDECLYDIAAWLDLLQARGYTHLVLQGHSFGAVKVTFYQSQTHDERVKALIIASPGDVAFWREQEGSRLEESLKRAKQMIGQGRGNESISLDSFPYPLSAEYLYTTFGPQAKTNIFAYCDPAHPWAEVKSIRCPILALYGTENEPVVRDTAECLALLKSKAVSSPRCDTVVVQGAEHNYRGRENEVAKVIADWLDEVFRG
ncbi:MAG: alpha/beta hydrolase family protein [Anaerolineae bacterium]